MSTGPEPKGNVMPTSFALLLALASLLWMIVAFNGTQLRASDAAGNGLVSAFCMLVTVVLWIVCALLIIAGARHGQMPAWMKAMSFVLVPASGIAAIAAIHAVSQRSEWPVRWPLVVPDLAPALLVLLALWVLIPAFRRVIPPWMAGAIVFGSLSVLVIATWFLVRERARIRDAGPAELQAIRAERRARGDDESLAAERAAFGKIDPRAPSRVWLSYSEPGDPLRDEALDALGRLPLETRQQEIELLVDVGHVGALRELPNAGIEATPALCKAATDAVAFHATRMRPRSAATSVSYSAKARDVEYYMPSVEWLVARGCDMDTALDELERTALAYGESDERERFLARLAKLRRHSGGE